jgi:hypothetical protein
VVQVALVVVVVVQVVVVVSVPDWVHTTFPPVTI